MRKYVSYIFVVCLLSGMTSLFGIYPNSVIDFLLGFGVSFLFWCGMLAPMLSE
jgi:hypothetical protein